MIRAPYILGICAKNDADRIFQMLQKKYREDRVKKQINNLRSKKFVPVSEVFVDGIEFRLPYVSKQKRENILKEGHVSIDAVIKSATKLIQVHNVLAKWN